VLHCLAFCVILCFCDETLKGNQMTAKAVNYTAEQTAKMVADYQAGTTVETIAETLGKTVRSVVAKLSREKVYVAKTYVSKTGEAVVKKDYVADYIGEALGLTESDTESLTKANKNALKAIADFIKAEKT
jgi:predicted transcriptional regulator